MYPAHQVLARSGYAPKTVHVAICVIRKSGQLVHSAEVRRSTKGRRARRYWTGRKDT